MQKMECENRQRGLRLWSKTNLTFGKGFEQLNLFCAAQNIPCRIPADSIANENISVNKYVKCGGINRRKMNAQNWCLGRITNNVS